MKVCRLDELPSHIKPTKDCIDRKTVTILECKHCHNEYAIPPHKAHRSLYCSKLCQNRAHGDKLRGKPGPRGADNPNWKGGISKDNMHYRRLQWERYPERCAAREQVSRAVRAGKLKRLPCERCGTEPTVGHHPDYSKPLDVIWLCRPCHRAEHGGLH